jgi:uncharacterized peroxidase-related enzyme
MAFIATVSDEEASGEVKALFENDRARLGYVANHTRLFAHRPTVYAAWRSLAASITENMDARRYELVTVAAARKLRSSYCTLAHGKVLLDRFLDASQLRSTAVDHHAAGLDEVDVAVMDFAERVVDDATSIIPADVEKLRELGLSDVEIFDVVLAAAARCFFSKTLDALCIEADSVFSTMELRLREALTVGRPIAEDG